MANPQGTIAPLALRNQLSCQWNVLGPLKGAYQQYPWHSSRRPDVDRCKSRVSRSFWRGRFGCVAAPAVAMPESDLEVTAMLSRATERVGLEWRKPPCPEPSRLDDWFLVVACAGSQRPAPGASLPDVHEGLTGRGRHLLLARNRPANSSSLTTLVGAARGCGGPPWKRSVAMQVCPYTVSTPAGQTGPPLPACRLLVWSHPARLMWPVGDAAST